MLRVTATNGLTRHIRRDAAARYANHRFVIAQAKKNPPRMDPGGSNWTRVNLGRDYSVSAVVDGFCENSHLPLTL